MKDIFTFWFDLKWFHKIPNKNCLEKLHFAISNFYGVRMHCFCLKKLLHFKSEFPTSNYSISGKIWQERKGNKELPVKKIYVRLDILEQLLLLRLYRFSFLFFSFSIVVLIVKLFLRLHSLCVLPSVTFWKKIMMMIPVTWIQNEYLHSTKIGYWCRRQLKNQWELPNCRYNQWKLKLTS